MKKLLFLFLSLLTAGSLFQACDNSKTYAEMLEDEKNAVERFIKDSAIHVISVEDFERNDTVTKAKANGDAYDEFVFFSSEGILKDASSRVSTFISLYLVQMMSRSSNLYAFLLSAS